jgi:hypothetical protein
MGKTVVLMLTCNKFKKTWGPFFTLFKKYWSDCPYEVIMGVDVGKYSKIQSIQVGKDLGWASNFIYILNKIDADRIIVLLDDYFLCKDVDTKKIEELVQHSREFSIGCLRTTPCPGPTGKWHGSEELGILKPGDKYRLSLQSAIWDKKVLLKLLRKGETPWATEIMGTKRSYRLKEPFVSVQRGQSPIHYIIGIIKGKWRNDAMELLKKEKIPTEKLTNYR